MTTSTLPAISGTVAGPHGILAGEPFSDEKTAAIVEQFFRDGYVHLGSVLTAAEVDVLRDAINGRFDELDNYVEGEDDLRRGISLMRMFEVNLAFRDLMEREPLVSLAEAILGHDCYVIAQNAMRNGPGEGITTWHVDDRVYFPVPEGMARYDGLMRVPCLVANFMIPLTDIPSIEYGPTQVVPGSHCSGRHPSPPGAPDFEGQGPVSLFANAGDIYVFHNQVWHRGAPNTSDRVRVAGGVVYGQRFVAQRFYPFLNYRMPQRVLEGAGPRLRRLLGLHGKGAYG